MSSYTITLKEIMEMYTHHQAYSTADRIEKGRLRLFDFNYPVFNEEYKKTFETNFIRNFYMREIGFETEGLFKLRLENWLCINMPYFNKLFESELIQYDPLINSKLDVTNKKTADKKQTQDSSSDGTSTNTSKQDASGNLTDDNFDRQIESTNPDSRLALTANDGEGVIEYANSIKENNENNKKTSSSTATAKSDDQSKVTSNANTQINETEDFIQSRVGKVGDQTYSKMMNEYRESLMRLENRIFDEMQELFMLVY